MIMIHCDINPKWNNVQLTQFYANAILRELSLIYMKE